MAFHPVDQSLKCRITLGGLSWLEMNNVRYYLINTHLQATLNFLRDLKFAILKNHRFPRQLNFANQLSTLVLVF